MQKLFAMTVIFLLSGLSFISSALPHHDSGGTTLAVVPGPTEKPGGFWIGYHPLTPPRASFTFQVEGDEKLNMDWQLPDGFTLGKTRFPDPQEIQTDYGVIAGFEAGSIILQEVFLPENWEGENFTIKLSVSYFVCLGSCQPIYEIGTLEATRDDVENAS